MRVVIDTNVLVSAVIRDADPEAVVMFAAHTPGVEWIGSPPIIREYTGVLGRAKFKLEPAVVARWLALIGSRVRVIEPGVEPEFKADQSDAKFLACAAAASADILISGDRALLGSAVFGQTRIVSVSEFKRMATDPAPPESNGG